MPLKNRTQLPRGFTAFLITETLGAFNDNFFKMLIQLYVLVIISLDHSKELIATAAFVFTLPFVIFGPWAGYLADKYSKTRVMQITKCFEILIMLLGLSAFYHASTNAMLVVLFLMASQSAFFSPAKFGFIPDTCPKELISHANGLMGMTTYFAIILGAASCGIVLQTLDNQVIPVAAICTLIAILGVISSFFITKTKAPNTKQKFPLNPLAAMVRDIIYLAKMRPLLIASLAMSYFWLLGLIFQTNILVYGTVHLGLTQNDNIWLAILPAIMGLGVALGSLLAAKLSGTKIETGLVLIGGLGLAIAGITLYFTTNSYGGTCATLGLAGICGGLFIIPLNAYLQYEAPPTEKGRVLATMGILSSLFLIIGSLIYRWLAVDFDFDPDEISLLMGISTFLVLIWLCVVESTYWHRTLSWLKLK